MSEQIKVLIVDDIPSTLDNLQKLLSFEPDIQVVGTAVNGKEGVEQAKKLAPDIILMDVNMPIMDGIQATELLAQEVSGSPVIIMSVQGERDYLRRAMQSGAREFLIKPFSGDELIASIRRVYQLEQKKESFLAKTTGATEKAPAAPADGEAKHRGEGGPGRSRPAVRRHRRAPQPGPLPGHHRPDREHRPHGPGVHPGNHGGRPLRDQGPAGADQPGPGG